MQLIIFVGMTFGWVGSYLFRVATKVGPSQGGRRAWPGVTAAWPLQQGVGKHGGPVCRRATAPCVRPAVAGNPALGEEQAPGCSPVVCRAGLHLAATSAVNASPSPPTPHPHPISGHPLAANDVREAAGGL